jgi:nucleotide-binding universal stress UspA family protein
MKILLATDGSPSSAAAVDEIARRPWPADTQVRIISVVEPLAPIAAEPYMMQPIDYFTEVESALRKTAREALERAAAKFRESKQGGNLLVSTEVLTGSPKRVIVEEAETWGADLIVVGSHGYGLVDRFLLGSVSQSVALHAKCSVEIVRCRKDRESETK